MATQLQLRRGTTAQHSAFTGLEGELTYDTSAKNPVIHDASTVGGFGVQTLGANALTTGANIATDLSAGNVHTATLTVNATLDNPTNPTNLTIGKTHTWVITQHASLAKTLTYGSFFKFQGSSTINSALGSVTVIRGVVESANSIRCWIEVPSGSILQTVIIPTTASGSTTSTTYVPCYSASITPKRVDSKIIAMFNAGLGSGNQSAPVFWGFRIVNTTSANSIAEKKGDTGNWTGFNYGGLGSYFVGTDTPASTSPQTYELQAASFYGAVAVDWNHYSLPHSTIFFEIAA